MRKTLLVCIAILAGFHCSAHNIEAIMLVLLNPAGERASLYFGRDDRKPAYTIDDKGRVYRGDGKFTTSFDALYTIRDGHIYEGGSTISFDILYTMRDGCIFDKEGESAIRADAIYSLRGNRVYKGDSRFASDMVYTIFGGTVYRGVGSHDPTDALLTIRFDRRPTKQDPLYP